MIKKRVFVIIVAILLGLCGYGCNNSNTLSEPDKNLFEFKQQEYAVGVDAQIQLEVQYENAVNITYVSSAPEIVSVSADGVVSGLALGKAEITANAVAADDKHKIFIAKCSVSVNPGDYEVLNGKESLIKWVGRTFVSENAVNCYNTASGFEADFYGTEFIAGIVAASNKIATPQICILIDDETSPDQRIINLTKTKTLKEYTLIENLPEGRHKIRVYKITEASATSLGFVSLKTDGYFLNKPIDRPLKIEVYGDSITAGYRNMRSTPQETADEMDVQNGCMTYAWLAAEELNAEINVIAQSGIGIYSAWGNPFILKDNWNKTYLSSIDFLSTPDGNPLWDFELYIPDIVLINIGTNDYWYQKDEVRYIREIMNMTDELFSVYGEDLKVVLLGGVMITENLSALAEVADLYKQEDKSVAMLQLPHSEIGHPRKNDNIKAGGVLAQFLKELV